jgi:5-methylcytosine-specific restriction endonuclease McrA
MVFVDGAEHFRCGTCRTFKASTDFHTDRRSWSGLKNQCRSCHSACSIATRDPVNARRLSVEAEARRRARLSGASGSVAATEWVALRARWGENCLKCGSVERLQWDHVVPLARGGTHHITNLQRLCRRCNERKQASTADYRSEGQRLWALTFKVLRGTER